MHFEEFRAYCLNKTAVAEAFPFDDRTLVFKVAGKLFALTDIENFVSINLKCDPEKAHDLRERYSAIIPGFHMNKKHWNTVFLGGDVSTQLLKELIDESYSLVVAKLPKKIQHGFALG